MNHDHANSRFFLTLHDLTNFGWIKLGFGRELDLDPNSLPPETLQFEVYGCSAVRFHPGSLSRPSSLTSIFIRSCAKVSFKKNLYMPIGYHHASQTLRAKRRTRVPLPQETLVDVSEAQTLLWETGAFRTVLGGGSLPPSPGDAAAIAAVHPRPPLSVRIQRVANVLVDTAPFGRLTAFHASEVRRLEMKEKAFSVEVDPSILASLDGSNEPLTTQVFLRGVTIPLLPPHAFPSSITEIIIEIREVGQWAFNLTVASANITHTVFESVRTKGFSLREWNRLNIHNNTFLRLESGSLSGLVVSGAEAEYDSKERRPRSVPLPKFLRITDNVFGDTPPGSLSLMPRLAEDEENRKVVQMTVADNRFRYGCRCGMVTWLGDLTKDLPDEEEPSPGAWSRSLYNTSMCLVDRDLARCFNVSVGFMRIGDFARLVCPLDEETGEEKEGEPHEVTCDPEEDNSVVNKAVVVVPDTAAGAGGADVSKVDDIEDSEDEMNPNKKILNTIFVAVVICICVILLATWVRRTRWWKRLRNQEDEDSGDACWVLAVARMRVLMMSPARRANGAAVGGMEDGISGADSITRLSVEGYNEMKEREAEEKLTLGKRSVLSRSLDGSGLLLGDDDESEGEEIEREDKATQTMPEELTHELLMALREKLDDPENYSEARDMIEHLYDIIKVEEERELEEKRKEALRKAQAVATDDEDEDDDDEENLYDVIQPWPQSGSDVKVSRRRRRRENATYNSVGTRAPSPDKLEPVLTTSASMASLASIASIVSPLGSPMPQRGVSRSERKRRPAPKAPVCEYVEPKDRTQHLYTELPVNGAGEASDPRPPRLRIKDEDSETKAESKPPEVPPPPSVPFKFLRTLGETFLTAKPPRAPPPPAPKSAGKSNGGIVCEYTEPTDARVHVYTELPSMETPSHVSVGQSKFMANRPLPHKPDSPESETPKASSSFASR
ncbi:hypothetical protein J437_LFUL004876 [Ladona fulva]|uniref:Uncharacterized protein n=1 Tax=Ladona fulva TaxID=123851 RepID=A0A8K0JV42_LADFU|nr:hypothetical protein J437_LFUL004876 [Ladona fulva]